MKTIVDVDALQVLSFADYKKALKKDKKFLKKAKAVLFINEHIFQDGKKGLGIMLFKKAKEVKETFKLVRKEWGTAPKNLAGGTYEFDPSADNWQIEIKIGACAPDKILLKGKAIFKSILTATPSFTVAEITEEELEDASEELKTEFNLLKPKLQRVAGVIQSIKQKDENAFSLDNANLVQETVEDITDWINDFDAVDEDKSIKKEFKNEAKTLQKQLGQLQKVADALGQRVVLQSFQTQYKEVVALLKNYQNN